MALIDLTGRRFGRLQVLSRAGSDAHGNPLWAARCDCGAEGVFRGSHLRDGRTASCGCGAREALLRANAVRHAAARGPQRGRSPDRLVPERLAWEDMIRRCTRPHRRDYKNYGARGIAVCARWRGRGGYAAFLADMGTRPSPAHSIDRIDGDGHYEPRNCRWATRVEQARNRRTNHLVTIGDETLCSAAWCERFGIAPALAGDRLRRGWDPMRALTEPAKRAGRKAA